MHKIHLMELTYLSFDVPNLLFMDDYKVRGEIKLINILTGILEYMI